MGFFETFSKRQRKREKEGQPDVYQYDDIPLNFRIQVRHIWSSAIGGHAEIWHSINNDLARELGVFGLGTFGKDPPSQCQEFLIKADTPGALDIIEYSFLLIDKRIRQEHSITLVSLGITQRPDNAIRELNHRFQEHGIGYEYVGGKIIRKDSQFLHSETVKPAITLLQDMNFKGALEEFLGAHKNYRSGRNKEAISDALKSFESTLKTICDMREWKYPNNATAKPLIDTVVQKGLIPPELLSHFTGLRSVMESGLPTLRNKTPSAHGQGRNPINIPDHMASYAIHLAASNIVFLVNCHKNMK